MSKQMDERRLQQGVQVEIGVKSGHVVIDFGQEIKWMALPPDQAMQTAKAIFRAARHAGKLNGLTMPSVLTADN